MDRLCTFCKGKGYTPYMCSRNRTYFIKWEKCFVCHSTGYRNYKERGQLGKNGTIMIGYIPKGEKVPTIKSILGD